MAHRATYLVRRGAIYYWRKRLPPLLDTLLARSHYCFSLRTSNHTEAARKSRRLSVAWDEIEGLFAQMARKATLPSREQAQLAINRVMEEIVRPYVAGTLKPTLSGREYQADIVSGKPYKLTPELIANSIRHEMTLNTFSFAERLAEVLKQQGVSIQIDSEEFRGICKVAGNSIARALEEIAVVETWDENNPNHVAVSRGGLGVLDYILADSKGGGPAIRTVNGLGAAEIRKRAKRISEIGKAYIESENRYGRKEKKTIRDYRFALRAFVELIGDLPISEISQDTAIRFREICRAIPSRNGRGIYTERVKLERGGGFELKPMPFKTAIRLADQIKDALDAKRQSMEIGGQKLSKSEMADLENRMSPKTINKHMSFFVSLFKWREMPESIRRASPFEKTLFPKTELRRVESKTPRRRNLEDSEALALFQTPIWSGSVSMEPRWQRGEPTKDRPVRIFWDSLFWVPLIALYSGMRREEVCQLRLNDLARLNDVWVFRIRPSSDTGVKTRESIRDVPVHDALIDIGLLEYHRRMKGGVRLFPELLPNPDGIYGDGFGKKIGRYIKRFIDAKNEVVFHSLRHEFITTLEDEYGASPADVHRIVGHELTGVVHAGYLGKRKLLDLKNCINRIKADHWCDFSHLYFEQCSMPIVIPFENWQKDFEDQYERRKYMRRL